MFLPAGNAPGREYVDDRDLAGKPAILKSGRLQTSKRRQIDCRTCLTDQCGREGGGRISFRRLPIERAPGGSGNCCKDEQRHGGKQIAAHFSVPRGARHV
jgi:hypothetical protein